MTTALFSVYMIKKRVTVIQWISLIHLTIGVILVQWPTSQAKIIKTDSMNQWIGLASVLASCIISAFTGVYFEKILKQGSQSIWIRNAQLSFSSVIFSLIMLFVQDGDSIVKYGFFQGYNFTTWLVIFLHAFGGLVVSFVIKYSDNILKGFATSISIVLSTIVSYFFLKDYVPSFFSLLGSGMVIMATITYAY